MNSFDLGLAVLSAAAYQEGRNQINVVRSTGVASQLALPNKLSFTDGFEAYAYNYNGKTVISYTGTEVNQLADDILRADLMLGAGIAESQLRQAAAFYQSVKAQTGDSNIIFTGHSLGGGLAAVMGVFFNKQAVTFDPAPFRLATSMGNAQKIRNFLSSQNYAIDTDLATYTATEQSILVGNPGLALTLTAAAAGSAIFPALGTAIGIQTAKYLLTQPYPTSLRGEEKISGYSVQGEFLTDGAFGLLSSQLDDLRIKGTPISVIPVRDASAELGVSKGLTLHSINLLILLAKENRLETFANGFPGLLKSLFNKTLYARTAQDNAVDFLAKLVQLEFSSPSYGTAGSGVVAKFANDLDLLVGASSPLPGDAKVREALMVAAMEKYYFASTESSGSLSELFVAGDNSLNFKYSDIDSTKPLYSFKSMPLLTAAVGKTLSAAEQDYVFNLQRRNAWHIQSGDGAMTFTGNGTESNAIIGGAAADTLTGGSGIDNIIGGGGADIMDGGTDADILIGGEGIDTLTGGTGRDTLVGGSGNDTYKIFAGDGIDTIIDSGGDGNIHYYKNGAIDIELKGGKKVTDSQNSTVWQSADKDIFYKTLGNDLVITFKGDANSSVIIKNFSSGQLGITLEDFYQPPPPLPAPLNNGTAFNDNSVADSNNVVYASLAATGINQEVSGFGGSDRISVSFNGDIARGGDGNDYLINGVNGIGDQELYGDAGNDILTATAGDDKLFGGIDNDALQGGTDNDYLDGGDGNDLLDGGLGADTLIGGAGSDFIIGGGSFEGKYDPVKAVNNTATLLEVDTDGNILGVLTAKGASGLAATSDDLQIAGDAGNIIDAGAGNDLVFGGTGSDVIDAGADNDIVIGLAGDDIIRGGSGNDKLHGDGSPGTFGASSGLSATTAPDQHGNDDIDGGAGNDEIFGDGGNDTLLGGDGEDTIRGDSPLLAEAFHGDDFIDGGEGADIVFGGAGNDTIFGGASAAGDTLGDSDRLYGEKGDDVIDGEDGDDLIDGGAGNDTLYGSEGADQIVGDGEAVGAEQGDDLIDGGDGADLLVGGGGKDTIVGGSGNDTILGDNNLDGSTGQFDGDDVLDGEAGDDTLFGQGGKDLINGGVGDDFLLGGADEDQLFGDEGNDQLQGGTGDDSIAGGDGDDKLFGEAGNDTLLGGAGSDQIAGGEGNDAIDGGDGDDFLAGDGSAVGLNGGAGEDTIYGGTGGDLLVGESGNDHLFGEDGDDELQGGDGNDILDGGAGNNYLAGGLGSDTYIVDGSGVNFIDDPDADSIIEYGTSASASDFIAVQIAGTRDIGLFNRASVLTQDPNQLSGLILKNAIGRDSLPAVHLANGEIIDSVFITANLPPIDVSLPDTPNRVILGPSGGRVVGGSQTDVLIGGIGDDVLFGGGGSDVLSAGAGVNSLDGGAGDDIYVLKRGDGITSIHDSAGLNRLNFEGIAISDIVATRTQNGTDDVFTINFGSDGEVVQLEAGSTIATVGLADNSVLSFADFLARVEERGGDRTGTAGADALLGSTGDDRIYGLGGNDTLQGGNGADLLDGGEGNDLLEGGNGYDTLIGGAGTDTLDGGVGDDTYVLKRGGGRDTVSDDDDANTILLDGINLDDVSLVRAGDILQIGIGGSTDSLVIADFYANPGKAENWRIGTSPTSTIGLGTWAADKLLAQQDDSSVDRQAWIDAKGAAFKVAAFPAGSEGDSFTSVDAEINLNASRETWVEIRNVQRTITDTKVVDVLTPIPTVGVPISTIRAYAPDLVRYALTQRTDVTERKITVAEEIVHGSLTVQEVFSGDSSSHFTGNGIDIVHAGGGSDVVELKGDPDDASFGYSRFPGAFADGGAGDDILKGGSQNDMLAGNSGNDILDGGGHGDTYLYAGVGDGWDTIEDTGSDPSLTLAEIYGGPLDDVVEFGPSVTLSNLKYRIEQGPDRDHLKIYVNGNQDGVMLGLSKQWQSLYNVPASAVVGVPAGEVTDGAPNDYGVERIHFGDGTSLSLQQFFDSAVVKENEGPELVSHLDGIDVRVGSMLNLVVPLGTFVDSDSASPLLYDFKLANGDPLPPWLSFDQVTRTLSGIPPLDAAGNLALTLSATDLSGATSYDTVALSLFDGLPEQVELLQDHAYSAQSNFYFEIPETAFVDAEGAVTLDATLADGQALPSWLAFDAATRTFSGTSGINDSGLLVVAVTATDRAGQSVSGIFNLTIGAYDSPPEIAQPIADQSIKLGEAFSLNVASTFVDAEGPVTLQATLANGQPLPSWLVLDAQTRSFSGTPDTNDAGRLAIAVFATDSAGNAVSDLFNLTYDGHAGNDAPIATGGLNDLYVAEGFGFVVDLPADAFVDPDLNDTLQLSATLDNGDPLPAWLSFDATMRQFIGNPGFHDAGAVALKVTATDSAGLSVSSIFQLNVMDRNAPPTLVTGIASQAATANEAFSFAVPDGTFTDEDGNETLMYSASLSDGNPLPSWLSFDPVSRIFSGTPGQVDISSIEVAVRAQDPGNSSTSTFFYIDVAASADNRAPQLVLAIDNQLATEDASFAFTIPADTFTDADAGDILTLTATLANGDPLPSWLTFDATTRSFAGTPANGDVGAVSLLVTATDPAGASVSSTFSIGVDNVNGAPIAGMIDPVLANEGEAIAWQIPANAFIDADLGDPLVYTVSSEDGTELPAWLTFEPSTGTLNGMPDDAQVGSLNLKVTATDSAGASATQLVNFTISNVNDAPIAAQTIGAQLATENAAFTFQIPTGTFIDADAGDTLALSATLANGDPLPGWLTVSASGTFAGTPPAGSPDAISIVVKATDAAGTFVTSNFQLSIANAPTDPNVVLTGTRGTDTLTGGSGNDTLSGGGGSDTLNGLGGQDTLNGDNGADTLNGGDDADLLFGNAGTDTLNGDAGNDVLRGGTGGDTLDGGADNDLIFGDEGLDRLFGGSGNDLLDGGTGADILDGGLGNDVLQGGQGRDVINDLDGNNLFAGSSGSDTLTGGNGNNVFMGGATNDVISSGAGNDLFAFNAGDGDDHIRLGGGSDALSLGGGIRYEDLALSKQGNDLRMTLGNGDTITFDDWYSSAANRSLVNLQVIADSLGDFDPTGSNTLKDNRVELFNFQALVAGFDAARDANPNLNRWKMMNSLLGSHLGGIDSAALGGDLAYQYGQAGSLANVGVDAAQALLANAQLNVNPQALLAVAALQAGGQRLM